jgi:hypothetical protein
VEPVHAGHLNIEQYEIVTMFAMQVAHIRGSVVDITAV